MAIRFDRRRRKRHKRKYQFIERKQQVRFAITVALFSLLLPGFIAGVVLSPFISSVLIGGDAEDVRLFLFDMAGVALAHWWVVLMGLVFVGVCSVVFSHKLFGPIRRFETALVQKRWDPDGKVFCSLRQGDYFKEFSVLLQEFLDTCQMPPPPMIPETSVQDEAGELENSTEAEGEGDTKDSDTEEASPKPSPPT